FLKLARGVVPAERNQPNRLRLRRVPLTVKPWAADDVVETVRVAQFGAAIDLPRAPRIFLIPETGHIQVGDERALELVDPGFVLPERIVVRVRDDGVPLRDGALQLAGVVVRQRT